MKTIFRFSVFLFAFSLIALPAFPQDKDNDRVLDELDNCSDIWNPHQKDLDQDGTGDKCDPTTKIISFSELTPEGFAYEIKFLFNENLSISSIIDSTDTFVVDSDSIRLLKALNYDEKDYYVVKATQPLTNDTLDVLIFVDRAKKKTRINKTRMNWKKRDLGPLHSLQTPYKGNISSYYGEIDIFSAWQTIGFDFCCLAKDIDQDGDQDLVIGDSRVNHKGLNLNIHQLSEPVYLLQESKNEFEVYYNSFGNKMIFHTPQAVFQADINRDGTNEILNLGEHYHALIPVHHNHYQENRSYARTKGLILDEDYGRNDGKKHRYYSWNEYGELKDEVSKIILTNETGDGFLSHYSAALGDIDLDGDTDYVVASQVAQSQRFSYVFDVLVNDGVGNFTINRKEESRYYTSEGYAFLTDLNDDAYPDLIFGGGSRASRDSSSLGYFLNDKNGHFDMSFQLIDRLHIALGARNIFESDLDQDGNKELIVYYSTGYGSNGGGMSQDKIPNVLRIYELENGGFTDVSESYFNQNENDMNVYTQTGHMKYFDIDYDGDFDLVPRFHLEDPELGWDYPGNGYRGDWNDSKGFQYFAYDAELNKFTIQDLGELVYDNGRVITLYNSFDYLNLDDDPYYEWVSMSEGFVIIDPIYIEPIEDQIVELNVLGTSAGGTFMRWDELEKANQYQIHLFRGDSVLTDTVVSSPQWTFYSVDDSYVDLKIRGVNIIQTGEWSDPFRIQNSQLTSIYTSEFPYSYSLSQNYPNPFNPSTMMRFDLPEVAVVRLEIFNMLGQSVDILVDGLKQAGVHTVEFDASELSTGVYFYRLDAPGFSQTRQMILVK